MKSTGRCARIWRNTAITPLCQSVYRRSMKATNVCRMRRQTGICTTTRKQRWRSWAMSGMRFPIMPDRAMPAATTSVTGQGASSLVGGKRFQVTADLNRYLVFTKEELAAGAQYEEIHELSRQERMEEFMFLGLRKTKGISKKEFIERFGCSMDSVYGKQLIESMKQGMMKEEGDRVFLTQDGILVSNQVLCEFLFDEEV